MPSEKLSPALWTDDERWQALMDNVKDYGIFMLDPAGKIATWNLGAERILGYKEDEILGHNFCEIFTPHDIGKEQPEFELQEAREKGRAEDERWHLRKDGTRFWASGVVTPLWGEDGNLRGFTKVLRDITERKQFEDRISEENQRKDEFLAMLSHELRNPLGTMKTSAEMLSRQVAQENAVAKEMAGFIASEVDRTNSLITRFLDFARPQHLKPKNADITMMLDDAIARFEREQKNMGTSVRVFKNYSPDVPPVRFDAELMERVIANLLVNAAQASPAGGIVTVKTLSNHAEVEVAVIDRGSGIDPKNIENIFNPFFTTKTDGIGFGLAIISKILDEHSGRITVESTLGEGSVFRVFLPIGRQ